MNLVYDLNFQPVSVGDLLTHQQASLVLKRPDDPVNVAIVQKPREAIPPWLKPVARVNQFLGEVYDDCKVNPFKDSWPEGKRYSAYDCWDILVTHFEREGSIPAIRPRAALRQWAQLYLSGATTIQLRRNVGNPGRNSNYREWLKFVRSVDDAFVIICAHHEIDPAFEQLPNVRFACREGLDTEQLCALVEASPVHMGVASGPAQMRVYGKRPFCIFNETLDPKRVRGFVKRGDGHAFPWTTQTQRLLPFAETFGRIAHEYRAMHDDCRRLRPAGASALPDPVGAGA